jgi:hypothetical protein
MLVKDSLIMTCRQAGYIRMTVYKLNNTVHEYFFERNLSIDSFALLHPIP